MNKILITGVGGFIASKLATRFLAEGFKVVGVDDLSNGKVENIPSGVDFIKLDLADQNNINYLPTDCNCILHLAGQSSGEISYDNPIADLQKNTISTLNLINYGIANKMDRIVYASSMSVYGTVPDQPISERFQPQPLSCYGVGKLASEGYLRAYQRQLPFVSMRMFNVYGPGQDLSNLRQGMVSIYIAQAIKTGKIEVKGDLLRYRDFIYIDDVVESWFKATLSEEAKNEIINIGTGQKTFVGNLLEKICKYVPDTIFHVGDSTPGDQRGIYADNTKLTSILGISDFEHLESGLEKFIAWANSKKI